MPKILDENAESSILDGLFELGLKGKEAQIYLALIKLGEVGTSKISQTASLHRQYVYQYLDSLEKKGLVQHVIVRGRKKFSAKNPEVLTRLLDQKKIIAHQVITDISKIAKLPQDQVVRVIQGDDAYVLAIFEMTEKSKPNTEVLVIGGDGDRFPKILGDRFGEYNDLRVKKGISVRYIGSEKQRDTLSRDTRKLFSYRLLGGDFTDITHTVVWPDFITLDTFGVPVTQTIIYNPAVSAGYKEFFETLWKLGK